MSHDTTQRFIGALRRADDLLLAALRMVLAVLLATMVMAVLAQVFTRYVMHFSLSWSGELARLCFVCLVFLGAACLSRRDEHLSVSTLIDLLPERLRSGVMILVNAVSLYCCWYLIIGSYQSIEHEWAQLTPAMQIPMGVIYSTVFVGIVLMMVWLTANIARHGHAAFGSSRA